MPAETRRPHVDPRRGDQRSEPFETPSREDIVAMTAPHVAHLERSAESSAWRAAGMNYILITAVGRKTGAERKTPLPYWLDRDCHRIITASFAGAPKNPAWYVNIADREANPTIRVQERAHVYQSTIEILDGDEYDEVWDELTTDRPYYLDYREISGRVIPLVRLPEPAD